MYGTVSLSPVMMHSTMAMETDIICGFPTQCIGQHHLLLLSKPRAECVRDLPLCVGVPQQEVVDYGWIEGGMEGGQRSRASLTAVSLGCPATGLSGRNDLSSCFPFFLFIASSILWSPLPPPSLPHTNQHIHAHGITFTHTHTGADGYCDR